MLRRIALQWIPTLMTVLLAGCYTAGHSGRVQLDWMGPVPALQLYPALRAALVQAAAAPVDEDRPGSVTTDWTAAPGRRVGILWWERTLSTRVRYILRVERDFLMANEQAAFRLRAEVQERPNDTYPWASADPDQAEAAAAPVRAKLIEVANRLRGLK